MQSTSFRSRLLNNLQERYPAPARPAAPESDGHHAEPSPETVEFERRLGALPPEVGTLLLVIGIAGMLLPGPVGSPFFVAGGLILWPNAFGRIEAWFGRRFPATHREGIAHIERFLNDLEHRYPGTTTKESLDD